MVLDHYKPQFDRWWTPAEALSPYITPYVDPFEPYVAPQLPTQQVPPSVIISPEETASIKELIKSFKEALEAAKVVDKATNQPDCEDPEKKKLEDRVAALEKRLDELTQGIINQ